jgi:hypothetical protein
MTLRAPSSDQREKSREVRGAPIRLANGLSDSSSTGRNRSGALGNYNGMDVASGEIYHRCPVPRCRLTLGEYK